MNIRKLKSSGFERDVLCWLPLISCHVVNHLEWQPLPKITVVPAMAILFNTDFQWIPNTNNLGVGTLGYPLPHQDLGWGVGTFAKELGTLGYYILSQSSTWTFWITKLVASTLLLNNRDLQCKPSTNKFVSVFKLNNSHICCQPYWKAALIKNLKNLPSL